jgi:putative membrane protein
MKCKTLLLAGPLVAAFFIISCDDNNDNVDNSLNTADTAFMLKASLSNSAEIDLSTLASTKATNIAVKAFAQTMVADHTAAQAELKALGTTVGSAVKDTIDAAHVTLKTQLTALTGGRVFDSSYIWLQVADHQTALTSFQAEQTNGRKTSVVAYANTNLPKIQAHFTRADSIARAYFPR